MNFLCISIFFSSTIIIEVFFNVEEILILRKLIIFRGLFILIPSMMILAISGKILSKKFVKNDAINKKQKRMPIIAFNGLLILIPSAIFLYNSSIYLKFDTTFYIVQSLELIAGLINIFLMYMNFKDSKKIYSSI